MVSKETPIVILIDLDGTIIGNVSPQVCEWEIMTRYAPGRMKVFRDNLKINFKQGLLRPNFISFLDYVKYTYNHVEYYVYTASETKWAHVIIPCIEQEFGITFNRPIFNRNHCFVVDNEFKKSPCSLLPQIVNRLKQKYEMIAHHDVKQNIIMIDNSDVVIKKDIDTLIMCPTYNFTIHYDVLRNIDEETLQNHYIDISKILNSYKLFPSIPSGKTFSYEVFKGLYFEALAKSIKNSIELNSLTDDFWKTLADLLTSKQSLDLSPKGIKYINNKLAKK